MLVIAIFCTALSYFFEMWQMLILFTLGNVAIYLHLINLDGEGGVWSIILYQFPAIIPSVVGIFIGQGIKNRRNQIKKREE